MFCIFALTFLYNKLFYSLIYVHLLQVLKFFVKVFRFLCFVFYFAIAVHLYAL